MTNLRVLAFCDYYDPNGLGGAERVAREVYRRMVQDHGASVTVVGAVPNLPAQDGDHDGVRVRQVRGHDLSRYLGAQLMVAPRLRRLALERVDHVRPDVVHINGLHFHSSAVGRSIAKRHKLPVVTTAHLGDVSAMPGRARIPSQVFDKVVGGRVVRASDRVIAVSRAVADHVQELGASPASVVVALNGVDHDTFNATNHSPPTGPLRAVIIGRLIANKGCDLALHAVAGARKNGADVSLTVIGDGPLRTELQQLAGELGLDDAVTFTGQVANIADRLADADVLLRPSYTEGLPLAVLEALASGVPVICSDVPGNVEAVRDGLDGLVVRTGDVASLQAAIVQMAQDPPLLERMAHAAVEGASRFTWDACATTHFDVMAEVASRPPTLETTT